MNKVEQQVRDFIAQNFVMAEAADLAADQSLMEARLIDSTGVLELVAFLEEAFGVQVSDADLVPENLDTIGSIVAYVQRKTGGTVQ
jgi:acyl carrier protein